MSWSLERIGGIAAILQGALFVLTGLFVTVLLPGAGIPAPAGLADPDVLLPIARSSALVSVFTFLNVPVSVCITLTVLGLEARLSQAAPTLIRIASVAGLASGVLFLAVGMARFVGVAVLAGQYPQDPEAAGIAFRAAGIAVDGMYTGAIFAAGWWAGLASWAMLRSRQESRLLGYLGLAVGLSGAIAFLIPVQPLLGLIWFPWLGLMLLREQRG